MKAKIKLFLPLVLICSLLIGSTCFASSSGRGWIYSDNSMNYETISKFNSMSRDEQSSLIRELFPIISKSLGFVPKGNDAYTLLNNYYTVRLGIKQNSYSSADEFALSDDNTKFYYIYRDGDSYKWFKDFSDMLTNSFSVFQGQLVMNNTDPFYFVSNGYVDNFDQDHGFQTTYINSYKNINSSVFGNLTNYNNFIKKCDTFKSNGFKFVTFWTGSQGNYSAVNVHAIKGDVVRNGLTGKYTIVNSSGSQSGIPTAFGPINNTTVTNANRNMQWNLNLGGPSTAIPYYLVGNDALQNGSFNFNIYSLDDDRTAYQIFTSISAYVNNKGHFEYPYTLSSYYNNVPTTNINSQQMTQLYNSNYTDNSNNSTNNTTNIYYPDSYVPDSNSYDKDTHKLDFSGVGALLASIGELIGSLINGIAQGIANIVSSIASVVHNLVDVFTSGNVFEFLKVFMAWLPEPIPTLLISFFTLSVLFAVIKLVKGALS